MGFESINQPGQSSEVEHNPKMSILFFWLERGGRWHLSPSTSTADHQKLNIIQKWAFYFLAGEGWWTGFESIDQPSWSSQFEHNPKTSILFVWLATGGGWGLSPLTSLADHEKLNVMQKWAFHFFWLERGGRWGSSPSTSLANHEKLNIMQKQAFYFFGWRGVADEGLSPLTSLADHQKLNVIKKWAFYFFSWRGVADRVWVHQPARPIITIWM